MRCPVRLHGLRRQRDRQGVQPFGPPGRRVVMKRTTCPPEMVSVNRLALAAGLLLAAGLAGCGGDSGVSGERRPPSSATPSTTLLSMPDGDTRDGRVVPIERGTYLIPSSAWSVTDFTVTFPEGWTVQYGHVYHQNDGETAEFYTVKVNEISTDACQDGSTPQKVGPRPQDLVAALLEQEGPVASDPVETTLGGYAATRIDLGIPKDSKGCSTLEADFGLQLWYSRPADKYFVLLPDGTASVYVVDVDGNRQVFVTQVREPASAADRAELQTVLDSIRIER